MPISAEQDQTAAAVMNHEHTIQTGLVSALCDAVERGEAAARIDEILAQLVDYSSAHFMSEELLMRLVSYDDYDDHVADHIHMMDALEALRAHPPALMLDQARAIQTFMAMHINTRDQRFALWQADR